MKLVRGRHTRAYIYVIRAKRVKIPPIRLTQRCGTNFQVRCLHSSVCSQGETVVDQRRPGHLDLDSDEVYRETRPSPDEPTHHQLDSQAPVSL